MLALTTASANQKQVNGFHVEPLTLGRFSGPGERAAATRFLRVRAAGRWNGPAAYRTA